MYQSPRQAAAIVIWRARQKQGIEVFIAQRAETLAAFGGFWAFVGGTLDAEDAHTDVDGAKCAEPLVAAAARELFEETGILALHKSLAPSAADKRAWRHAVLKQSRSYRTGLAERGLRIDGARFVPFGQWQSPPFSAVRFDCQYFALQLPESQAPDLWDGELTQGRWLTPKAALDAHDHGEMLLAYPVLATMRLLHQAQGDVAAAAARAEQYGDTLVRRGGTLVPGVRMLPLKSPTLPPATHTNCYILGEQELIIVDPGTPYPADQTKLLDYIDGLTSRGARVREIWLTHAHPDHTGAAALAQRRYNVPIAAHADCAEALRLGGDCQVSRHIDDDAITSLAGDYHWQALHTPGHAPGHLCFYETKRRHLLSGDNVLGQGSSIVAPSPHGSMRKYMRSLRRLLSLELGILLPGHGPPVATAVATLKRYIAHREAREAKVLAALGARVTSSDALLDRVYDDVKPAARPMAQISLAAHIEKLVEEKRITAIDGGFVRC